jgi:hypothetical protein
VTRAGVCAAAIAFALAIAPRVASATDSTAGPLYVQGGLGVSFWDFPRLQFGPFTTAYSWTGFDPQVEVGYHFSGRHDGFVLALRQAFIITALNFGTGNAAGLTSLRGGYDLAFKAGSMEINVDPFATFGVGYIFDGAHAGIEATGGLDIKLFFTKGVYAFARPGELGFQCFHDVGDCAFSYAASLGAGFAFGGS